MHFLIIFFSQYSDSCYHLLRESLRIILDFTVGKYLFSTILVYMKSVFKKFLSNLKHNCFKLKFFLLRYWH